MFKNTMVVMLGAGIGGVLRYGFSVVLKKSVFPLSLATLGVNVVGGLLMGLMACYFISRPPSYNWLPLFLLTGVCGGFTTFSAFSLEVVQLLQQGKAGLALACVLANVICAVVATALGFLLCKALV